MGGWTGGEFGNISTEGKMNSGGAKERIEKDKPVKKRVGQKGPL